MKKISQIRRKIYSLNSGFRLGSGRRYEDSLTRLLKEFFTRVNIRDSGLLDPEFSFRIIPLQPLRKAGLSVFERKFLLAKIKDSG